jgi:hypothetical protein
VLRWLERGPVDAIQYVNAWRPAIANGASEDESRLS